MLIDLINEFRFPVADLQPLNKRRPWWIQALHKEILTFDLKQIHFQSDIDSEQAKELLVTSESIQGQYSFFLPIKPKTRLFLASVFYHNHLSEQAHIAQLSSSNGEVIKVVVNVNDLKEYLTNQLNPTMTGTLSESIFSRLPVVDDKLPLKNKNTLNDNRQILEVADDQTIERFIVSCSEESKLNLQVLIPYILLYIPDQVFLNTIYNR